MDQERDDHLFRCFSEPGRRRVARLTAETPLMVGEISEALSLPQSTVSRHLKFLRRTGLLVERRLGNRVYVGLVEADVQDNGDPDLAALVNRWLRRQPLEAPVQRRLESLLERRDDEPDAFGRLAHQWDELRTSHFGNLFHWEALASLLPREWHVLDIGTGTGYFLPFLARHFARVTAVDPSPAMLELAQERCRREGLSQVDFRQGRLESLPVKDSSLDAVLAILVFRHADADASMAEVARVLSPGGSLLAVDVTPHRMDEFRRRMGDRGWGVDPATLAERARAAGLEGVDQRELKIPCDDFSSAPQRSAPPLFLLTARRPKASGATAASSKNKEGNRRSRQTAA